MHSQNKNCFQATSITRRYYHYYGHDYLLKMVWVNHDIYKDDAQHLKIIRHNLRHLSYTYMMYLM